MMESIIVFTVYRSRDQFIEMNGQTILIIAVDSFAGATTLFKTAKDRKLKIIIPHVFPKLSFTQNDSQPSSSIYLGL